MSEENKEDVPQNRVPMIGFTGCTGNYSTAIGPNVKVEHDHCCVIGENLKSKEDYHILIEVGKFRLELFCKDKPHLVILLNQAIRNLAQYVKPIVDGPTSN